MLLTQSKFAELIGTTRQTVGNLVKNGTLHLTNKKIKTDDAFKILKSTGQLSADNKFIPKKSSPVIHSSPSIFDVDPASYPTLSADEKNKQEKQLLERAMEQQAKELGLSLSDIQTPEIEAMEKWEVERFKIFYQGMLERAKYFKEIGRLVDVEEVKEEQFGISRTVRDAVMSISNRIAHKLINKTEIHEIKLILDAEALKVMENLSL